MIRAATCPICRKPLPVGAEDLPKTLPFCSERCRQIDFFRWFEGKYAIEEPLDPESLESGTVPEGDHGGPDSLEEE